MENLEITNYGERLTAYIAEGFVVEDGFMQIRCSDQCGKATKELNKSQARALRNWINEFLGEEDR